MYFSRENAHVARTPGRENTGGRFSRKLSTSAALIYFMRGFGRTKVAGGYSFRAGGSSILFTASLFLNPSWNTTYHTKRVTMLLAGTERREL